MTREEKLIEIFEDWFDKTDTTMELTIYTPCTPHFSSYDSWKLASLDDYYNEKEITIDVDYDDLLEYFLDWIDGDINDEWIEDEEEDWDLDKWFEYFKENDSVIEKYSERYSN